MLRLCLRSIALATFHASHCSLPSSYGELIYLLVVRRTTNLKFLIRDAALLRFFHGLLITAPQVVIHLYTVSLSANSDEDFDAASDIPLYALATCMISLAYTILTFTTSNRLSHKQRRIVLPAHLLQVLWYVCFLSARIIAFALFAHAYGLYVFVIVAGHWILTFFGILRWRTTFCSDITRNEIKSRWYLELPFDFVAACVYIFVFFNLKEGRTRFPSLAYHVLVFVENAVMVSLFFVDQTGLSYAPASIPVVVGVFVLGVCLMLIFYLVFHPRKTFEWYWIGVSRNACSCCASGEESEESTDSVEPRPRIDSKSVNISGPTLVSMNGAIPGLSVKFGDQSFGTSSGDGMRSGQAPFGTELSGMGPTLSSSPPETSQPVTSSISPTSPPPLPTPLSLAGDVGDKSIDSPMSFLEQTSPLDQKGSDTSHYDTLASVRSYSLPRDDGTTLSPESRSEVLGHHQQEAMSPEFSKPFVRKPPTPYPISSLEEDEDEAEDKLKYPYFGNIPAKKLDYHTQPTQLEQHYFPNRAKHPVSSPHVAQLPHQAVPSKSDPEYFYFPSPSHQSSSSGASGQHRPTPLSNQETQSSPSRRNRTLPSGQTPGSPERRRGQYHQPQPQARAEWGGGGRGMAGGERERPKRNLPLYGQVYTPERSRQGDPSYSSVMPRETNAATVQESAYLRRSYGVNLNTGYRDKFQDPPRTLQGSPERTSRPHWSQSVPTYDQQARRHPQRASWSAGRAFQRDREGGGTDIEDNVRPRTYSEGSNHSLQRDRRGRQGLSHGFPVPQAPEGRGRDVLPPDWATRHPSDITFTHRSPLVTQSQFDRPVHLSLKRPASFTSHTTRTLPFESRAPPSFPQDYPSYPNTTGHSSKRASYHGNRYPLQSWTKASTILHTPTAQAPATQV